MEKMFDFVTQDIKVGLIVIFCCCLFSVIACLIDMWTAIEAVKARGGKPSSHPMKRTQQKIIDYIRLILYVLMLDILGLLCLRFYNLPYCVVLITIGNLLREGTSVVENYKMKKSGTENVLEIAKQIVSCVTNEDAKKIITAISTANISKHKEKLNNEDQ